MKTSGNQQGIGTERHSIKSASTEGSAVVSMENLFLSAGRLLERKPSNKYNHNNHDMVTGVRGQTAGESGCHGHKHGVSACVWRLDDTPTAEEAAVVWKPTSPRCLIATSQLSSSSPETFASSPWELHIGLCLSRVDFYSSLLQPEQQH